MTPRDRYDLTDEDWAAIRRVSTDNQYDNFRFEQQERQTTEWLGGLGARVHLFDENVDGGGKSGRHLEDRPVARAALDAVEAGRLRGIAGLDFARLSRDEYGIDAGTMFERVANARGRIAAERRIYDPRDPRDLDDLRRLAAEAGRHMLTIRDQFWDGLFGKAERDIFFQGIPPFGYSTRRVIVPDPRGRRNTPRLYNKPQKHPEHLEAMADLTVWFETCATWAEVLDHFNPKWGALALAHARLRTMPENRDRHGAGWGPARLRQLLDPDYGPSEVYTGRFRLGRRTWSGRQVRLRAVHKKTESPVWDKRSDRLERYAHLVDGRAACPCGRDHAEYGDLSYWTAEQAARWLAKFAKAPVVRRRRHPHLLRGLLVCIHEGCGAELVGAGAEGYVCPRRQMRACPGTRLGEEPAWRMLRELLPDLLQDVEDYAERAAAKEAAGRRDESLREALSKERHWEARVAFLTEQCYGDEVDVTAVPKASFRKLTEAEEHLEAARAAVTEERARLAEEHSATAFVAQFKRRHLEGFDRLPREKQARVYRHVVRGVRIAGKGSGSGRTWAVVGYESLAGPDAGIGPSISRNELAYIATALGAAA
jgi:hypothetical protein